MTLSTEKETCEAYTFGSLRVFCSVCSNNVKLLPDLLCYVNTKKRYDYGYVS